MNAMQPSAFFSALFTPYQAVPDANRLRLELRTLCPKWRVEQTPGLAESYPDGGAPRTGPREWFPLSGICFSAAANRAQGWRDKWDVYIGVLPRIGEGGGQKDVPMAAWLWADVDGGDGGVEGATHLVRAAGLPRPNLAVVSGGGLHCYWRLQGMAEVCAETDRQHFKDLLKRLCRAIGGSAPGPHADSSRADTASILRVPGTLNLKIPDEPRAVKLIRFAPDVEMHSLTWWKALLPPEPAPAPRREYSRYSQNHYAPQTLPRGTLEKIAYGAPLGERHKARLQIAVSAAKSGYDEETIAALLDTQAQACGSPPGVERANIKMARWAIQTCR